MFYSMAPPSYGFDVSGESRYIEKVNDNFIIINTEGFVINENTSLNEAINICKYAVEFTVRNLKHDGNDPVCGGPISIFSIRDPNY